jgi:UDP-N-acetylglucosamine acyltransferase
MSAIDPTARVDKEAVLGPNISIGPYCVVGPNVTLGEACRLVAHVHITGHTTVGAGTVIAPFASLGTPPQSVKYRGGPTRLVIGASCDIREGVTMNTGTEDGGGLTQVGEACFFMVGSHVGHDCVVGSNVTFANNAVLGGHVVVGDNAFFGGQSAIHQFTRIGEGAMIGGVSGVREDVIPFGFALGQSAVLVGLNIVGLRRRGVTRADIHRLRSAYRLLFFGDGHFAHRVDALAREYDGDPIVDKVIAFIRDRKSRPLMKAQAVDAVEAGSANTT